MEKNTGSFNRRNFIKSTTGITTGFLGMSLLPQLAQANNTPPVEGLHIIGPKEGYSQQIGTLVSMMTWMRTTVLNSVTKLTKEQLDYLHDQNSNTIGSMLMHLGATETFYQANTFEGRSDYNDSEKVKWEAAMELGDAGRKTVKGHDVDYYLSLLQEAREKTLAEFKKRDDKWLMAIDPKFFGGLPTNNFCKWFHVCEHESNHNGQIKWLKGRMPGAKAGGE